MEKKTIGKFISALRKANGMTQKELGEKLFVSDKMVSRSTITLCGRNEKNEDRDFSWARKVFVPVVTIYSVNEMRYQPKIKK